MAYTNINVGQGKSVQKKEADEFTAQLLKNKRRTRAQRGLEADSGLFDNETASEAALSDAYSDAGFPESSYENAAPEDTLVSELVANTERSISPEEAAARQVATQGSQATQIAADMQPREGNNPQGSIYTGPANVHMTDMDRVNSGLPDQRVDELRNNINTNPSLDDAAGMLPNDPKLSVEMNREKNKGIIASHKQLSGLIHAQMGSMSTGFGSQNAREMIDRVAEDTNQDPKSVAEWFQTILTDHKTLTENGVPEAFSDAALTSVLSVMKKNRFAQYNREGKLKNGDLSSLDSDAEVNTSVAHDEEIGGLIETAFGKKDSTAQTRAITGAIARRVVTDALGGYEINGVGYDNTLNRPDLASVKGFTSYQNANRSPREVTPAGLMKAGLFHSKKIKIAGGKDLWVTELTDIGMNRAMELEGLGNIILPGLRKDVNSHPPLTEEGFPKMSSDKTQSRQDPSRLAGEAKGTNEGIYALESVANAVDQTYGSMLLATMENVDAVDLLMKDSDFVNLIGLELPDGNVVRLDNDGNAFAQQWRLDNNGNKVVNPRYNPMDPSMANELEFETESLMGDKAKMVNFQQDIQWLQDHFDDTSFYYTYFIGGAKRVHVAQTVGNYQSSKLVRSLLRAAVKSTYNVDKKMDVITLQAGILKKLGMNKANQGSNAQLASKFQALAGGWSKTQSDFLNQGGKGFAPALIKDASRHEGWMSLNAISEAISFHNFQKDSRNSANKIYKTGFITEIDGLANGLAINSMQAGDLRVAGLTGMIPIEGEEYSLENNDVYTITSEMFKQQIQEYAGKNINSKFKETWDQVFEEMFEGRDSRNLSKTALMIFGYGAGDATIREGFSEYLSETLEGSKIFTDLKNTYNQKAINTFLDLSGKMMVKAVQTNFPEMQELAKVLSSITGYAVSLGIEPHTITDDYDYIEFGLSQRVLDEDGRMKGSYKPGKRKGRGGPVLIQRMKRLLDASGVETKGASGETIRVKYDKAVHKLTSLKASKQAPVLITQAIDAIVMMRAISNLRKNAKSKDGFFAAQIYDGMLMTPKDAQEFSHALHKEIMKVSRDYSSVNKLIESIQDLDSERFQEIARVTYANELGRELTKKELTKVNQNPLRFFLANVPWRGKKGDTVINAISRIEKRRAEAVKRMDINKMYQYAWDWPATK